MSDKPKIFIFSNVVGGGDGVCLALAEDGHCLGSHWCSHEGYARLDLGMVEPYRQDRRDAYTKHYPNGYEMVFVPASEVKGHPGIDAAYALNQRLAQETKADEGAA